MDIAIKKLISEAKYSKVDNDIEKAFNKLQKFFLDSGDKFTTELYILCAETAIKKKRHSIVEWCLNVYFERLSPHDEYLCRAYLCQAQALAFYNEKEKLDLAFGHLLKCISLAKEKKRNHYVVYNASLVYWSLVQRVKTNKYNEVLKSLCVVVQALQEVEDQDYEWRVHLTMCLLEFLHQSNGNKDEVQKLCSQLLDLTLHHVHSYTKTVLNMLHDFNQLQNNENVKEKLSNRKYLLQYYTILKLKRISDQNAFQHEAKSICNAIEDSINNQTAKDTTEIVNNLIELCRTCSNHNYFEIAEKCIIALNDVLLNDFNCIEKEILKNEITLKKCSGDLYSKSNVEIRLAVVDNIYEQIVCAFRMEQHSLIQLGCVSLWNACLLLLNHNIRHHVFKPLKLIAEKLEFINSTLLEMRCQVHIELATFEVTNHHQQLAFEHLKKASILDVGKLYATRIQHLQQQATLDAMLYTTPERVEDQAAQIVSQVSSVGKSATETTHAHLKKAGLLLSPEAFKRAVEGESGLTSATVVDSQKSLLDSLNRYRISVSKIQSQSELDMDVKSIKERVLVWSQLAKVARKLEVWDICRVACVFFLHYGKRPHNTQTASPVNPVPLPSVNSSNHLSSGRSSQENSTQNLHNNEIDEKDAMQLTANINFIYAECLVQLLKTKGSELFGSGTKVLSPPTTDGYTCHDEWVYEVSTTALAHFQAAADIGVKLNASWIVTSAAVYVWNYTKHLLQTRNFPSACYTKIFTQMQRCGGHGHIQFVCDFGNALALELIESAATRAAHISTELMKAGGKRGEKSSNQNLNRTESDADLKQASQVLEHILSMTSSLTMRYPVLRAWVRCKGLMGQARSVAQFEQNNTCVKAVCQLEALKLHTNKVTDFSPVTSLKEIAKMVGSCSWEDNLVQMDVWSDIATLSYSSGNAADKIIAYCDQLLQIKTTPQKNKSKNSELEHDQLHRQTLLYQGNLLKGRCLVSLDKLNEAMKGFLRAIKHAHNAKSYNLAMNCARHYWNFVVEHQLEIKERQLFKTSLEMLLKHVADLAKNRETIEEEDLKIRSSLYNVLFNEYIKLGELEECLLSVENALKTMPRGSPYKILLFKHRVQVLARLDRPVTLEMGKFRNSPPSELAQMWHAVARYSNNLEQKITAYTQSIDVLATDDSMLPQCANIVVELAELLTANKMPKSMAIDRLYQAVDLLLPYKHDVKKLCALVCVLARLTRLETNNCCDTVTAVTHVVKQILMISIFHAESAINHGISPGGEMEVLDYTQMQDISLEEVVTYQPSDEHKQFWKEDTQGLYVNKTTLGDESMQFFQCLETLVQSLVGLQLHRYAFYLLALQLYLANVVIESETLQAFVRVRAGMLCRELRLDAAYKHYVTDDMLSSQTYSRDFMLLSQYNQESSNLLTFKCQLKLEYYSKIALCYLELGEICKARLLLANLASFQKAFPNDENSRLRIVYGLAKVYQYRGKFIEAIKVLQNEMSGNVFSEKWLERVKLLVDCLCKFKDIRLKNDHAGLRTAERILRVTITSLFKNSSTDQLIAVLELKLGRVVHSFAGKKVNLLLKARSHYKKAAQLLDWRRSMAERVQAECEYVKVSLEYLSLLTDTQAVKNELVSLFLSVRNAVDTVKEFLSSHCSEIQAKDHHCEAPAEKLLTQVQLCLLSVTVEVMTIAVQEAIGKRAEDEKKTVLKKFVDNYINDENRGPLEAKWDEVILQAVSMGTIHNENGTPISQSEESMMIVFETLKLMHLSNEYKTQGAYDFWPEKAVTETTETSLTNLPYHVETLSQVTESMMGLLNNSLDNRNMALAMQTSYHLLNILDCESRLAVQLLALYQSCCASLKLHDWLKNALSRSPTSVGAAALQDQYNRTTSENILKDKEWWKRLSVHQQQLSEVPFNMTYVILQHSPDLKHLYAGVLKKPSPVDKKGVTSSSESQPVKEGDEALVHRMEVDEQTLRDVLELFTEYKSLLSSRAATKRNEQNDTLEQSMFDEVVTVVETYLDTCLSFIRHHHHDNERVVLLGDAHLLQLPLEALFNKGAVVCRDFSLQMHVHRLNVSSKTVSEAENSTDKKSDTKKSATKKPPTKKSPTKKSPTKKSETKRPAKGKGKGSDGKGGICGSFEIHNENIFLDLSSTKFILDAYVDKTSANSTSVLEDTYEELVSAEKKSSKWLCLKGSPPDRQQMQTFLQQPGSAVVINGYECLFSLLEVPYLAPLSITEWHLAVLLDRAHVRQPDEQNKSDGDMGGPVETAALLSMFGVASLCLNQWSTSTSLNCKRLNQLFKGLLEGTSCIGDVLSRISLDNEKEENEEQSTGFERYNMVLYGLPNFINKV